MRSSLLHQGFLRERKILRRHSREMCQGVLLSHFLMCIRGPWTCLQILKSDELRQGCPSVRADSIARTCFAFCARTPVMSRQGGLCAGPAGLTERFRQQIFLSYCKYSEHPENHCTHLPYSALSEVITILLAVRCRSKICRTLN